MSDSNENNKMAFAGICGAVIYGKLISVVSVIFRKDGKVFDHTVIPMHRRCPLHALHSWCLLSADLYVCYKSRCAGSSSSLLA